MKIKLLFLTLMCSMLSWAQSIFTNPITGTNPNTANPYATGQTANANITVSGIGRGSGIVGNAGSDRYNARSWNTSATIDSNDYFEFTLTPNAGYEIDFVSFVYTAQVSSGTPNHAFRSSIDGFASNIGTPTTTGTTISLSALNYQNITTAITFRFYTFGVSAGTTTFSINDFTFNGNVAIVCTPPTIASVYPASGPEGTEVTINASSGSLLGATAAIGGIAATVISSSATQLIITVPGGAMAGGLVITDSQPCEVSSAFTFIEDDITSCEGTFIPDLIIYEVHDEQAGAGGTITLFNGTGATVNLSDYRIYRTTNQNDGNEVNYAALTGSIASGALGIITVTGTSCTPAATNGGLSGGFNENDGIQLRASNGTTVIDDVDAYVPSAGYYMVRNAGTFTPRTSYVAADWTTVTLGAGVCTAGLGTAPAFAGAAGTPNITTQPSLSLSCNSTVTTISLIATEGFAGSNPLVYQWYVVAPNTASWTALTNTGVNTGATSATLSISSLSGLEGNQYYCEVQENTATCYTASRAVKIDTGLTIWNGTVWSNGTPSLSKGAIINGTYDMNTLPSFDACSVIVENPAVVTVTAGKYINIQNDLTVNAGATVDVLHQGSLVMIDDAGVVTNNGTMRAYKTTQPYELYDYTYWSSPMTNCTIASALGAWRNNYTFAFEPANYIDANLDGFDDSLDAWVLAPQATTMSAGKGYIAMAPTTGTFPTTRSVTFTGTVNNGVVTTPIALSGDAGRTDEDFNLIGNPYPSAVFADDFINTNTNLSGTLYFWTHIEDIDINTINPGPQLYNFRPDDYATYNLTGGTAASVNGGLIPTGYIASGQGFFVEAITAGNVTFNNAMRNATHINTNFYRNTTKNRIWLSIQNEVGMFSQQLLGYLPGTSLGFDRAYDGLRNKVQTFVHFYSLLDSEEYKIQSRGDFNDSDAVPLGYQSEYAGQFKIKIDRTEGVFNTANVYLEDRLLNMIHDLRQSDYTFTTAVGKFNNRFVLRYNNQVLSNTDFESIQNSVAVFTSINEIKIDSAIENIKEYEVYDVTGKTLVTKKGLNTNIITVHNIAKNNQALLVKVTLENDQVVTKKIVF